MSANIFERKGLKSEVVDTKVKLIDKSSTGDEKSSNVDVKSPPKNHVQVKLFLIACLAVGILLVFWLMMEFKKPTEEFGSMPKVSYQ